MADLRAAVITVTLLRPFRCTKTGELSGLLDQTSLVNRRAAHAGMHTPPDPRFLSWKEALLLSSSKGDKWFNIEDGRNFVLFIV